MNVEKSWVTGGPAATTAALCNEGTNNTQTTILQATKDSMGIKRVFYGAVEVVCFSARIDV